MNKLSFKSFLSILFICLITLDYAGFTPRFLQIAGNGAIFALLFSVGLLFLLFNSIVNTTCKLKNHSLKESLHTISPWQKKLFLYFYAACLFLATFFTIRILCEKIYLYLLPNMPLWIINLIIVLFLWWADSISFNSFSYVAKIFAPLILILLLTVILPPLTVCDFSQIFPLDISAPQNILKASFFGSGLIFTGLLLIPVFSDKYKLCSKKEMKSKGNIVLLVLSIIFIVNFLLCIGIAGKTLAMEFIWPNMDILQASQQDFIFESYELFLVFASIKMSMITAMSFLKGIKMIGDLLKHENKPQTNQNQIHQTLFERNPLQYALFIFLLGGVLLSLSLQRTLEDAVLLSIGALATAAPIVFSIVFYFLFKRKRRDER